MVDAADLKSALRKEVWVRVPPSAYQNRTLLLSSKKDAREVKMKKWSWTLKVFLIVLAVAVLYVLVRTIIRVSTGEIETGMAVTRFLIGTIIGLVIAGIAAGITSLAVTIKQKKKLGIPLIVFLAGAVVAISYVLIRTLIRVNIGEITGGMAVFRFIIGSIMYVAAAGVLAGITKLVLALKNLGK
jgi:hypothetical protein